jgi:2-keto-3-deoxy-L-rhamnonate aldolase RhmA
MKEFHLRPSRVLRKLRAGEAATCVKINTIDPRVAEIASAYEFDCIWLDNEHVPSDWLMLENMVRAAKLHDTDTIVRVSRGSYSDYVRPLEMDASGLMVPHLMDADEARQVVQMTRFHPVGRRPVDSGNLDGFFCQVPILDYIKEANEERFVCVQIEDPEALEHLDQIAATPGIDIIFFGPGDFAHSIGKLGQGDAPEITNARRAVADAAKRHGKFAGVTATPATVPMMRDEGFQFLGIGADVIGLCDYFRNLASALTDAGVTMGDC